MSHVKHYKFISNLKEYVVVSHFILLLQVWPAVFRLSVTFGISVMEQHPIYHSQIMFTQHQAVT